MRKLVFTGSFTRRPLAFLSISTEILPGNHRVATGTERTTTQDSQRKYPPVLPGDIRLKAICGCVFLRKASHFQN